MCVCVCVCVCVHVHARIIVQQRTGGGTVNQLENELDWSALPAALNLTGHQGGIHS